MSDNIAVSSKSMRGDSKRLKLISAASVLIMSKGINNFTLADVAKESEVPLGNIYYYFKTKEDLIAATLPELRITLNTDLNKLDRYNIDSLLRSRAAAEVALFELLNTSVREFISNGR